MKKIFLLGLVSVGLIAPSFGKGASSFYNTPYKSRNSGSYNKGASLLTLSYGVPNSVNYHKDLGIYKPSDYGTFNVKYEFGILPEVGIQVHGFFNPGNYKGSHNDRYSVFGIGGGVMGFYHFNKLIPVKQLDVFAGAGLGMYNRVWNTNNNSNSKFYGPQALWTAGARWYFNPKFAAFAEAGYSGLSNLNLGITFKFK